MKPEVLQAAALCTQANNSSIIYLPLTRVEYSLNKIPWSCFSSMNSLTLHFHCAANPFVSICLYPRRLDNDSGVLYQVASCIFTERQQHFFFLSFSKLIFCSQLDFTNYHCFKRKHHVGWNHLEKSPTNSNRISAMTNDSIAGL